MNWTLLKHRLAGMIDARLGILLITILAVMAVSGCSPPPVENGSLRLEVAEWVNPFGHNGGWGVVPAGMPLTVKANLKRDDELSLPPGRYDVYWNQDHHHERNPMLLAGDVLIQSGQVTTVPADSGLRLDKADWVPDFGHEGWWGVVPPGEAANDKNARTHWAHDNESILLPPGTYDVYWVQDYKHQNIPLKLSGQLTIEPGQLTGVPADSGLRLDKADWVPDFGHEGWWGVVPPGEAANDKNARTHWAHDNESILLPPGTYDVYWVQDYKHQNIPLKLSGQLTIEPGQLTGVPADSGLRLDKADWVPDFGHEGWWGVVPPGEAANDKNARTHWAHDNESILLPPGAYNVYWVQDYKHRDRPLQLATGIVIESAQATILPAASGIQLNADDTLEPFGHEGWWAAVPAGKPPEDALDWSSAGTKPLLLPPGTYDLYWKQDYKTPHERVAQSVEVGVGELSLVAPNFETTDQAP